MIHVLKIVLRNIHTNDCETKTFESEELSDCTGFFENILSQSRSRGVMTVSRICLSGETEHGHRSIHTWLSLYSLYKYSFYGQSKSVMNDRSHFVRAGDLVAFDDEFIDLKFWESKKEGIVLPGFVTIKNVDIFKELKEGSSNIMMHGCNTLGVMGAGIALAVSQRNPNVLKAYQDHCERHSEERHLLMGTNFITRSDNNEYFIINSFTQNNLRSFQDSVPFCKKSYSIALEALIHWGHSMFDRPPKIAMPKIGCGLGGGNWKEVLLETWYSARLYNARIVVCIPE